MTADSKENMNEVICACSGTRRREIAQLIAQGETDLERISRITGAGSGCGGCEFEMRQMLTKDP